MLDVFTIGFVLFVAQADKLADLEPRKGQAALWVAFGINLLLDVVIACASSTIIGEYREYDLAEARKVIEMKSQDYNT